MRGRKLSTSDIRRISEAARSYTNLAHSNLSIFTYEDDSGLITSQNVTAPKLHCSGTAPHRCLITSQNVTAPKLR